ncbi:hypothetical protein FISHEDRAFT_69047 [Fistulina hepatica ATCC 64428]|uniref:Uncharacterized protein n=1 Tax=Fistulina hepatica ATCC 64428 TaxID=1128425 RepID=A0A0D7APG5_9AGAR|nr:hypothetical protein FISHEDRAFT_69047 [Fistulina hepatica ATCC 64428]
MENNAKAQSPGARQDERRNAGRGDGTQWNGSSFICPVDVDGEDVLVDDDAIQNELSDDNSIKRLAPRNHEVSLNEIARPARKNCIRKEFELISKVKSVQVIEDDQLTESERWAEISDESWDEASIPSDEDQWATDSEGEPMTDDPKGPSRRTYSEVLKNG